MTSSIKRPAQSARSRSTQSSPQLRAQGSSQSAPLTQVHSISDDSSEEEHSEEADSEFDPDQTGVLSRPPSITPSPEALPLEHNSQPASQEQLVSSAQEQQTAPDDMTSVPEHWLGYISPEQLAIDSRQQQELFVQIKLVDQKLYACESAQEHDISSVD
ncbi:hypothetical protein BGZ95_007460, partial [Linnemannia exigua]